MEGPDLARQSIPSSMLSISNKPIPDFKSLHVDAALAARGREYFSRFGCAGCHDDIQVGAKPAKAFSRLGPRGGCLSESAGPWPRYDLNTEQREWIATALPTAEIAMLDDLQLLNKTLVTFNCLACHERSGLGGIPPERHRYFSGTSETLGDQGRLPPPLTHVGAKLTPEWLTEVLLRGKRQREYLHSAMPQFGEANVGHLVDLFGRVDVLESATVPEFADPEVAKNAGHQLIGTTGLSCIACHDFNGQKAVGAGALDIVHVTDRLRKNWFHLFMLEPARFHPTVIMPSYWPGGQSVRPDLPGGDASHQIEALWKYLEDGTRVKKPVGLSRQSRELRVGDVAEVCRGRSPIGYRGIAVGYPLGINLAFDSEQMSLRMLWKGGFANVGPGSFEPRGIERIAFPAGIPFHRLNSLDDNWPYKGKTNHAFPQDHGYQFRGYHLDSLRRPTFLYQYGDITVEDYFEDRLNHDGEAGFSRTIHFVSPGAALPFYFRVASGTSISVQSDSEFTCDQLRIRITSHHTGIVRDGHSGEVLIPLTLPKGPSTLTLEYKW
ncbi:MAG: hypothetical protein LR011_14110 [Verrucomicrobia bacterium]|nr:hypothetical protein [Verrucomicrobiota bacterium]